MAQPHTGTDVKHQFSVVPSGQVGTDKKVEWQSASAKKKRCLPDCSRWAHTYCPTIDVNDPYAPFLECGHVNVEKSCLCSLDENTVVCGLIPSFILQPVVFAGNVFLTPFVLAVHFVRIYMLPAITSVFFGLIEKFVCVFNICSCGFTDIFFPPNDRSIGSKFATNKPHTILNLDCWHRGVVYALASPCYECFVTNEHEWKRAGEIYVDSIQPGERNADSMKLFTNKIEPSDIGQGQLGDCWLLASLACVAERNEECIKSLFLTRAASQCGYYKIRLYDVYNGPPAWRTFTIDDWIPVLKGTSTPAFTRPHGHELWVMLLEKAFAKMMGSFHALDGGLGRVPFRAMTGNTPIEFVVSGSGSSTKIAAGVNPGVRGVPESLSYQECWHVLNGALKHGMIACCGSKGTDNSRASQGIVLGHMYSILDTCTCTHHSQPHPTKLIKLRNPWGKGEWTGAFSDNDRATHGWVPDGGFLVGNSPGVSAAKDDGIFWMPFNDFLAKFDYFCLCAVASNMSSLHLEMCEEYGPCGPMCGCLSGAGTYCLQCEGVQHLWCPQSASTLDLILAFKTDSLYERIENCCSTTSRMTREILVPSAQVAVRLPGDLF